MPWLSGTILPNSPLLLPKLAPEVQRLVAKTRGVMERLIHEIYARQPSLVVMVSVNEELPGRGALLQSPSIAFSFAEYGDVVTSGRVKLATGFTHSLKERVEIILPLQLRTPAQLPLHFAVPTVWLNQFLSGIPYVFLELSSRLNLDEIETLGKLLAEYGQQAKERLCLIATGVLAQHKGQLAADARVYDRYFLSALEPLSRETLWNIDPELRRKSKETLWLPSALLASILSETKTTTSVLSYEAPAYIGYVVAQFDLI